MLNYGGPISDLWKNETLATIQGIQISREIATEYYVAKRNAIMGLSRDEAVTRLIEMNKFDSRISTIAGVSENDLMAPA